MNRPQVREPRTFLSRAVAVIALAAGFLVAGLMAYYAIDALLLIFAGLLFGVFLHGMSHGVMRFTPLPYGAALTIVVLALVAAAMGLAAYSVPAAAQQAGKLQGQLASAADQTIQQLQQYELLNRYLQQLDPKKIVSDMLRGDQAVRFVRRTFSGAIGFLGAVLAVSVVGVYFAAQPGLYVRGVTVLAPPARRARFREALGHVGETLWWFIIGRLISMAIIGVGTGAGLALLGVPFAVLLGVLAALLAFIPYIGPALSAIPALLLALQQSPQTALYVLTLYLGLQLIESYLVTPLVMRREVNLPPVVTIGALLAMGMLTGTLGLLLATPLAAAAMVLIRDFYIEDVLGDRTPADPGHT
jgi:predicted PurR-regulated permease PerM